MTPVGVGATAAPTRWHVCDWCRQPVHARGDWWLGRDGRTGCGPADWHPGVFPRDVFDLPDRRFDGLSYRQAVWEAAPSRHIMPWEVRPTFRPHTPLGTWWWENWGEPPTWKLADREVVREALVAAGLVVQVGEGGTTYGVDPEEE